MGEDNIPGFDIQESIDSNNEVTNKKSVKNKKSGGFQSMGLGFNVLKGITKRGYKIPTPIQRKTIPLILEGRDVVAMARTGSGKTACFLIPLLEKLKSRTTKMGARALILSPTRELALQTLKFFKEIGRFCDLRAAIILGGDSMDSQFNTIHLNPDVIIATPGRFLHICVEMDLKLTNIEYIVFDEADRLFEMGFGEQLKEIVNRLPESRQTLLFSATLPKVLVEFSKAGLSDPVLLRLDVESKLPDHLTLTFLTCRADEKIAVLLVLLKSIVNNDSQTVIFAATRHHVEYLHMILDACSISNTYIFSNLDPSARKIHTAKFSTGKVKVLIVTDIAARGIDIPQLDNVINFNFPAKSKLFVHRVGRCARAGRSGTAYSIISPDEYAYLLDLHLFLGRPFQIIPPAGISDHKVKSTSDTGAIGSVPQALVEQNIDYLQTLHTNSVDLSNMQPVCANGYQKYLRSRPAASVDSNRRVKDININSAGIHPIFQSSINESDNIRNSLLYQMKKYRPNGTIFEICGKNKSNDYLAMKMKREFHKNNIAQFHKRLDKSEETLQNEHDETNPHMSLKESEEQEVNETFREIVLPKKRKIDDLYKNKSKKKKFIKDENYINYTPTDKHTEEGFSVNSFVKEAERNQLELTGDSDEQYRLNKQLKKWDRKKKKMVGVSGNSKVAKIRTESGVWIPATYKSNRYAQWKERTKVDANNDEENSEDESAKKSQRPHQQQVFTHWARHNENVKEKKRRLELRPAEQILKQREIAERKKKRQQRSRKKKGGKKK